MKRLMVTLSITALLVGCGYNFSSQDLEKINETQVTSEFEKELKDMKIRLDLEDIMFSSNVEDKELEELIKDTIKYRPEYGEVRYLYNKIDLNDDGKEETIVYLIGGYVSGSGGTTVLLLDENMKLKQEFTLMNNPILISNEKTKGFKNIIVPVYGGGEKFHFAELKYDGESYPSNPSMVIEKVEDTEVSGISIISDGLTEGENGILLK